MERLGLTVVVPMFNEEQVLELFLERLRATLDALGVGYEVLCVDDGSTDCTAARLLAETEHWRELRVLRLVRNVGHQAALSAGFDAARGDHVVTIDADLQDPPELIEDMVRAAHAQGVDVVYAVRADRSSDTVFKRTTSSLYYRLMRRVAGRQVPHDAGDFRLVSRRVVEAMAHLPEHGRVHRLVIPWFGFPSTQVTYTRQARAAGRSKYSLVKMAGLASSSLVSFSAAPLRVATTAGFLGVLLSVVAFAWSVWGWVTDSAVPGWTSILATTGLLGAIQLLCLGVLGEYVSRIYTAIQRRPAYVVGYDSLRERSAARPPAPTVPAQTRRGSTRVDRLDGGQQDR